MKVAIVNKAWWPLPTSSQHTWAPGIVAADEASGLIDAGVDVRVYCAKGSKVRGEVIDFDTPPIKEHLPNVTPIQRSIREAYAVNEFISKVITHLRTHPVDVIHLHDYRDYPLFEAAGLGIPIVATIHGDYTYNFADNPDFINQSLKSKNFIALMSPRLAETSIVEPIGVVPNSFNASRFEFIDKPAENLVYAGRIVSAKGADIALEVAERADQPIVVYGGQFDSPEFEATFRSKIAGSQLVDYRGFVPQSEIGPAFDARAMIFPIRSPEGFPLSVLESLSCGTPVITFDVGSIGQLVKDGETGFVVPPGDITAMVEAVRKIDQIDRAACRAFVVNNFNPKIVAHKHIEVFEKVIGKNHKA